MSASNKTIQKKINELSEMVAWFDGEDFNLELAIEKFKQAEKLAIGVEDDLNKMKNEITIIKKKFDKEL